MWILRDSIYFSSSINGSLTIQNKICSMVNLHLMKYSILYNLIIFFKLTLTCRNVICSILLHNGLNPAWHFWLSSRFACCLKMKSVENILGYIQEQFYRFSKGCKPQNNLWDCSRKYTKVFKTGSFLGNKKLSLKQNVWRDHATMQQDVLLHFWVIFLYWNQAEIWKKYSVVQL